MTQPPEFPPPSPGPSETGSTPPPPPPPPPTNQPPAYPADPSGSSQPPPPTGTPVAPYGQQPYGGQSYYQQEAPGAGGWNGLAIAALVVGLFCWPLGFVFGGVALSQIGKKNQKGRGLAIAGLVLSTLGLIASIAYAAGAFDEAERDKTGTITDDGEVNAMELRVGDCFNGIKVETEVRGVDGVPCSTPHEGEVYAVVDLPDGDFPGEQAVAKKSDEQCFAKLESAYPKLYEEGKMEVYYLQPTAGSWAQGDRKITCVVAADEKSTGSIAD